MNESAQPLPGSSANDTQIFASKRDTWLVAVLLVGAIIMASGALVLALARPKPTWLAFSVSVLLLVATVFVVWMFRTTSYRVAGGTLEIRFGPFRQRIDLDKVEEVRPCRDALAGPALSLDRLRVMYRGSMTGVLISPLDRDGFLNCCVSHCRHLRREGDHLVRAV